MDHKEEQNNEIEALDSIYCGEMEILTNEPFHVFVIPVKSDDYGDETEAGLSCRLKFEYTPSYPEELPLLDIEETVRLEESDEEQLTQHLKQQAEENLGMVMVFTLVSAAQEWLNIKSDEIRRTAELKEQQRLQEEEEAEMKRFEGTRVTTETFIIWKQKFEQEMGINIKKEKDEKNRKLTGRELFMLDKSLNESDLKFLEEGGESIKVNESLFQDIEELDTEIDNLVLDDDEDIYLGENSIDDD